MSDSIMMKAMSNGERSNKQSTVYQPMTFDAIRIGLASPEKIREWSYGVVTRPETINYRTLKPETNGLFCERIFGPQKDWECHCGKYKKIRYKGVTCDRCGVEVTKSSVRRERMGHIELAAPVSHIWYFKGSPSRMGLLLDISPRTLEKILYFASYVVLDPGTTSLEYKQVLSEKEYQEAFDQWGLKFRARMGAEAIKELLQAIDLEKEHAELREEMEHATGQKRTRIIKRLSVVESFRNSGNDPTWMIMDCIPVIPPDLRPMVQLDGGRFATSDLNDLYRRIINRNNRLSRLAELGAPDIIVRNEKRMLQEAVDSLIDNGRRGRPVTGPGNRALKSLSDMLKGKGGRFRQNLLGKRVDYSGRSVIVVGPELKIWQCGLPKEMAIELFKPFVMKELVSRGISPNIRHAKKLVESLRTEVWDVLEDVIREHPVMLNRAPTLHRLGIQAFEPILVEGKAIKLHPLACTAFNADFDGDQMAVHLPLSMEAQAECRFLMLSTNNLLKPSDGGPVTVPTQDMVLGIYYLTQLREGAKGEDRNFKSVSEAILAYENDAITLQTRINVRRFGVNNQNEKVTQVVSTTLGRLLFNEILPQDLGIVDRSKPENLLVPEVDYMVNNKKLKALIQRLINVHGTFRTAEVLDDIKAIGYHYSTIAAMTVSISDMTVPPQKQEILAKAQETVDKIGQNFLMGLADEKGRYEEVISVWKAADAELTKALLEGLDKYNNIFMMADSGARGSQQQIKQLAGMRGLMADTTGRTIELPIKSNFREGLDVLEYFISAHGARKGLSDTALRTADSGYLTRRMVDVSQELIIREMDCCAEGEEIPGMDVYAFYSGEEEIEPLHSRIVGRFAAEDIKDKEGKVIVKANHMITPFRADEIINSIITKVVDHETGEMVDGPDPKASFKIRSILTCRSHKGICANCYGSNMATGEPVHVGEAVGIIAAQSIGEPGTQLTMRTFHTGGVAGGDITSGLPRVEELFEARKPKGLAQIAEISGKVQITDTSKRREVVITDESNGEQRTYQIPFGGKLKVADGQTVVAGDELTDGSVNPHDLLHIKGVGATQDYILREVQRVYSLQGVAICDKHIEVIVRQMLKKIRIEDSGDADFLPDTLVDVLEFNDINKELEAAGKTPATGERVILGITKAALATNSFLSAASFQETTKVLTDAAVRGKVDPLIGLKENVIIGKLIPAGTGMREYRETEISTDTHFRDPIHLVLKDAENAERSMDDKDMETDDFAADDEEDQTANMSEELVETTDSDEE